jgi:hypothetical protein
MPVFNRIKLKPTNKLLEKNLLEIENGKEVKL